MNGRQGRDDDVAFDATTGPVVGQPSAATQTPMAATSQPRDNAATLQEKKNSSSSTCRSTTLGTNYCLVCRPTPSEETTDSTLTILAKCGTVLIMVCIGRRCGGEYPLP